MLREIASRLTRPSPTFIGCKYALAALAAALALLAAPAQAAVVEIRLDYYDKTDAQVGRLVVSYDDAVTIIYPKEMYYPWLEAYPLLPGTIAEGRTVGLPEFAFVYNGALGRRCSGACYVPSGQSLFYPVTFPFGEGGWSDAPCTVAAATYCASRYAPELLDPNDYLQVVETRSLVTPLPAAGLLFAFAVGLSRLRRIAKCA
ncbi:MAG: hypothetical protein ABL957_15710 [Parvularculaceae bacterium]